MTSTKRQIRARKKQRIEKLRAWARNKINQQANKSNRAGKALSLMKHKPAEELFKKRVTLGLMTNWQKNQALKHCKGDITRMSLDELLLFSNLKHWKKRMQRAA